ncbi:MAG: class I SAM-dependent methyltransferase [Thermomicrobiales bacterium]
MADQAPNRETYTNTGNPTYEQRVLGQLDLAFRAPLLLQHLRAGQRLLDVGCGPGSITCDLAALVAPGEVIGIDLQASQVEAAKELAAQRGVANVTFEVGNIYDLPFRDARFDVGVALGTLFHLSDPLAALREMRRVLKPGSLVAVVDIDAAATLVSPSLPPVERLIAVTYRVVEHNGGNPYLGRHHRALLLEAGFARPEIYPNMVFHGTLETTRRAAETFVLRLQGPVQEAAILGEGWATREELDELYAAMRAWGERPDAMLSELFTGALAWAPG